MELGFLRDFLKICNFIQGGVCGNLHRHSDMLIVASRYIEKRLS